MKDEMIPGGPLPFQAGPVCPIISYFKPGDDGESVMFRGGAGTSCSYIKPELCN